MTFLNPLLLFGLLAATIPIIIHLLNLRKLETIEFSTLQFLKELQKTKMRRVKIRQWLLLALRTLLIIALVMAFARPALRGPLAAWGGTTHAKTTMILILDDSPSMGVRNERGKFFAQAKSAAASILELFKEGDEAYLLKLSDIRRTAQFAAAHAAAPLRTALDQSQQSQETATFRDALGVAAKLLSESKNFNQEIYLITDGQATQFASSPTDSADLFSERVRLFLADVRSGSTRSIDNAGVTSAEMASKIITQNKPLNLRASVRNASATSLQNSAMSVYLDGSRVLQHSVTIPSNGLSTPTLSFVPKRRGTLPGYLRLEDDSFEMDNTRYFVVNIPNRINVLCAGSSENATRLLSLALTLDKDSSTAGLFSVERILENQLSSYDLSKYDLLALANVKDLSAGEADRITTFVNAGGGLLVFAGPDADMNNYNSTLFKRLRIPDVKPAAPLNPSSGAGQVSSFLSFSKVEFEHPLFSGLFDEAATKRSRPDVESPRIFTAIAPQVGVNGRSIITLSDGSSFLTEFQHEAGRVLLYSVDAGLAWSDFPLKGLFVPLLYRTGLYLSQTQSATSFTVGDELQLHVRLKSRTDKDAFILRSPSGIDERVAPSFGSAEGIATFSSTNSQEAGIYELRKMSGGKDSELLDAIAVNVSLLETDLRHATADESEKLFTSVGITPEQIRPLPVSEKIDAAVLESRFGVELWKYFVGLALLLALAEMAIARTSKNEQ